MPFRLAADADAVNQFACFFNAENIIETLASPHQGSPLERKADSSEFTLPAYVLYRKADKEIFSNQIKSLFELSKLDSRWS